VIRYELESATAHPRKVRLRPGNDFHLLDRQGRLYWNEVRLLLCPNVFDQDRRVAMTISAISCHNRNLTQRTFANPADESEPQSLWEAETYLDKRRVEKPPAQLADLEAAKNEASRVVPPINF